MLSEPIKQSLLKFANRSDKEYAQYFVGRQDIIAGIENTVAEMQQLIAGQNAKQLVASQLNLSNQRTWLVQGAPGAGKSALQSHLQQSWLQRRNGPFTVSLEATEIKDEANLTRIIANAIRYDGAEKIGHVHRSELESGLHSQGGVNILTRKERRVGELQLRDLWHRYDRGLWNRIRKPFAKILKSKSAEVRPIVLLIDEIQNLPSAGENILTTIHSGRHGLPIVAVLAGLAWSKSHLRKAGLSRFSEGHIRTLTPLTEMEATDAVRRLLQEHYIKGYRDADIVTKIARWSNGWPQHLHNYMRMFALELVRADGNLVAVNEVRLRKSGDEKRENYYKDRLDVSRIRACENLLADVAEMIDEGGTHESNLLKLLDERPWDVKLHPANKIPQNMTSQEFIDEMIKNGMVHSEDGYLTIPIPSFRQYLIGRRRNV